ncbi:MAG: hypothetical protein QOK00_1688 [Thermoleophilaceae bacterium]|jgi:hypothetical protein|nr:hypothetical protein [Thermoleophilaceae bacterium]
MANRDKQVERAREALEEKQQAERAEAERQQLEGHDRPQDVPDPRTKSSRHKKVTADKWNQ